MTADAVRRACRTLALLLVVLLVLGGLGGCGRGEDRPGQVESESSHGN